MISFEYVYGLEFNENLFDCVVVELIIEVAIITEMIGNSKF